MERSNSDGDMLFNALEAGPVSKLTNWRSFPASMTNGTVSDLENSERVVLHVRRRDNIRSVYEEFVRRNGVGAMKDWMSARIAYKTKTRGTLSHSICPT